MLESSIARCMETLINKYKRMSPWQISGVTSILFGALSSLFTTSIQRIYE